MGYTTGTVHLRRLTTTRNGTGVYGFGLPVPIAEKLRHLKGRQFAVELTEEGVIFRLLPETAVDPDAPVPSWVED